MQFPLNYFIAISSPKQVFKRRNDLKLWQQLMVYCFLTALLVMPASLFFARQTSYPLAQFLPGADQILSEEMVSKIQQLSISDGALQTSEPKVFFENEQEVIGVNLDEASYTQETMISFNKNNWFLRDLTLGERNVFELPYSQSFALQEIENKEELETFLSEQFYSANRSAFILTMSFGTGILLFIMNCLLWFGAAFFIWLTRKSQLSDIRNYKESLNLILNTMGLGTIAASMVGFIQFDITIMIGVQSVGLIVMLFACYLTTRFKDTMEGRLVDV